MARFEAEKFCARSKLQFGMAPALVESFLKYTAPCTKFFPAYFDLNAYIISKLHFLLFMGLGFSSNNRFPSTFLV
jgi:hypothetical protein